MASFSVDLGGKKLLISAYAKNIVRIRVSDKFEPTLFEKYGMTSVLISDSLPFSTKSEATYVVSE